MNARLRRLFALAKETGGPIIIHDQDEDYVLLEVEAFRSLIKSDGKETDSSQAFAAPQLDQSWEETLDEMGAKDQIMAKLLQAEQSEPIPGVETELIEIDQMESDQKTVDN